MNKDIVILTKSRKDNGYCVAGLDIKTGKWVRLVSDDKGGAILSLHAQYQNTPETCKPLDVVRADIVREVPYKNHTEDCHINTQTLTKQGVMTLADVVRLHPQESHNYVFGNDLPYVYDYEMEKNNFGYSLIFIRVKRLTVHVRKNSSKADFEYNGTYYQGMNITDPEYSAEFTGGLTYSAGLGSGYLVVSMATKPYRSKRLYYKFIAKIFPS